MQKTIEITSASCDLDVDDDDDDDDDDDIGECIDDDAFVLFSTKTTINGMTVTAGRAAGQILPAMDDVLNR